MRLKCYKLTITFECGIKCLWYSNSFEGCKRKIRFLADVFGSTYHALIWQENYNHTTYYPIYSRNSIDGVYKFRWI